MNDNETMPETLQQFRDRFSTEHELWNLIELLLVDLEICRRTNTTLREQLNSSLCKNESIFNLYSEVEEKNSKLKDEVKTIKFKLNAQKLHFKSELSEIEKTFELKLKISEENFKKVEQVLNKKEREFFEELQMAQATAATEFEKIEKQLKWQLSEANKQLYEKNLINSELKKQLENFKNRRDENSMTVDVRNREMSSVSVSDMIDYANFELLERSKALETPDNTALRTYEPLHVENCTSTSEKKYEKLTPVLFKGKSRSLKNIADHKTNNAKISNLNLPPLIPCSRALPTNQKKRRLYDPDDLSYLVDLIPPEDN